jgi:hypothetical protein
MGRKNRRVPEPQGISFKLGFVASTSCERVVLLKREGTEEYKTITLVGTRDDVLHEAFSLRRAIVPDQVWDAVDQHAYRGPEDELLTSFGK